MSGMSSIVAILLAALVHWSLVLSATALWRRRGKRTEPGEQLYYVLSTQDAYGDHILFWKPDSNGYTLDAAQAGTYTWAETRDMRQTDMPIPVETVDAILRPALFLEDLRDHACFSIGHTPMIPTYIPSIADKDSSSDANERQAYDSHDDMEEDSYDDMQEEYDFFDEDSR